MVHQYIIKFEHPQTKDLHAELLKTETSRKSKVMRKLWQEVQKKYEVDISEIAFEVIKLK